MRIAFFIDQLFSGGAQRQSVELAVSLVKNHAIEASFLVYRPDDFFAARLEAHGIPVECVARAGKLDPTFPLRLRRAFHARRPDVVHAFMLDPGVWATLALRVPFRAARPRLVVSERWSLVAVTRAMAWKQQLAYGSADAVTSNAAPVARRIERDLGIPAARIHHIPNGIDLAWWDAALREPCPVAFDPERLHVGLVGRIEPEKNHALLVRALGRLDPSLRAKTKVWFVGSEDAQSSCRRAVETEIESQGLAAQVEFVRPQRNVAPLVAGLDLLALPSRHEAFPNAVIEAMASGVPVVATRVGDIEALVDEGRSGFVVDEGDEAALADRLDRVLRMAPETRRALGARGRAIVEERYRMASIADAYVRLYESLLG